MGLGGIEPPTSALSVLRSNRLSYSPATYGDFRLHQAPGRQPRSSPISPACLAQATMAVVGRLWTKPAERTTGGRVKTKARRRATARNNSGGIASSTSHVA